MKTRFHVSEKNNDVICCHYCNREQVLDKVKLV